MARITVDDCLKRIPNRFQLTLAATYRARQLSSGASPLVEPNRDKFTVIALREISVGKIGVEVLRRNQAQPALPAVPAIPAAPATPTEPAATVEDTRISIDDFMKVEVRVARVLEAEAVPKSKKLVKLRVDVGTEQRTIVAGIAEAYQPEQLVGRTIAIVFNLKPAKLMGIESNGMVLAASVDGGLPTLITVEGVASGARVR